MVMQQPFSVSGAGCEEFGGCEQTVKRLAAQFPEAAGNIVIRQFFGLFYLIFRRIRPLDCEHGDWKIIGKSSDDTEVPSVL
ncbi:MAG: hypothetical protein IJF78_05485 [Clostridia bacterium]|nr:hypothetical protein [Clostridia bacterium]